MSDTIKLLHLSYDPITNFELRVPKCRLAGEDDTTKRICLATCLADAINAKVGRAAAIQIASEIKIPLALYVYTCTLPQQSIVHPASLHKDHGVEDALLTQEYWALEIPSFEEHIFLIDHAEFEMEEGWPSPRVSSISTHEVDALPKRCFQMATKLFNAEKGTTYTTDFLLSNITDRLRGLAKQKLSSGAE